MTDKRERKAFTGRHAAMILVAFFGTVIGVNMVMASFALSTFGGTVVDNSYVASQHYNVWLARAKAQDRLQWTPHVSLDADRHVRIEIRKDGRPLAASRVAATASHPIGRADPSILRFKAAEDGAWRSVEPLAVGRQRLDIVVGRGDDEARYRMNMP